MTVSVITTADLDETLVDRWRQIQHADANLASPYFCPEYTIAAGEFYPNTRVGIIEDSRRIIGFFPFDRPTRKTAQAVAPGRTNYEGVIIEPEAHWDARELIAGCRVSLWDFRHLIASQRPMLAYHAEVDNSHVIDLRAGLDAYRAQQCGVSNLPRKARRLERELGPLRLDLENRDPAALDAMIRLKRRQYQRTRVDDPLGQRSVRGFLERIQGMRTDGFTGALSILHAGDTAIAADFGMRARGTLHSWFTAYDPTYRRQSPGLLLLDRMIQVAWERGMRTIDLGYGDEPYKLQFANRVIPVARGMVDASLVATMRKWAIGVRRRVGRSRLAALAHAEYCRLTRRLTDLGSACVWWSCLAEL